MCEHANEVRKVVYIHLHVEHMVANGTVSCSQVVKWLCNEVQSQCKGTPTSEISNYEVEHCPQGLVARTSMATAMPTTSLE